MAEEKDSISYGYGEGNQNMAKYSRTPNATPSFQVPVEVMLLKVIAYFDFTYN